MSSCILSLWETGISLIKLFMLGEDSISPRGKHKLKRAESRRCEVNTLGKLACNFSTFLRFLEGNVI